MGCRAPKAAKGAQEASGGAAGWGISMIWGVLVVGIAGASTAVDWLVRPLPSLRLPLHTFRTHYAPSARRHGASRQSNGPLP